MEPAFARIMGEGHTVEVQGGASTVKEVALTVNCDAQLLSKKGHGTFREKSSQHGAVLEPCGRLKVENQIPRLLKAYRALERATNVER